MMNPMALLQQLVLSGNPYNFMMQMFGSNPAMQRAMEMSKGKSEEQLKETVKNLSQQAGIDFSQLESMAKNFGIKL